MWKSVLIPGGLTVELKCWVNTEIQHDKCYCIVESEHKEVLASFIGVRISRKLLEEVILELILKGWRVNESGGLLCLAKELISTQKMARSHGRAKRRNERVKLLFFPGFPSNFSQKIARPALWCQTLGF